MSASTLVTLFIMLTVVVGCTGQKPPNLPNVENAVANPSRLDWNAKLASVEDVPGFDVRSFGVLEVEAGRELSIFTRPRIEQIQIPETKTIQRYRTEVRTTQRTTETGEMREETYEVQVPYQETVERLVTHDVIRGYESYSCPLASLQVHEPNGRSWTGIEALVEFTTPRGVVLSYANTSDPFFESFLNSETLIVASDQWTECSPQGTESEEGESH